MASTTVPDEIRDEKKKSSQQPLILRIIWHTFFIVVSLSMLLPFFWLITSSLKRPEQIFTFPPEWIPNPVHWDNYEKLFDTIPVFRYTVNTLTITFGATLGQVITASLVAYGFARLRFAGRDLAFSAILATLMLPYAVTIVPVYVMFAKLGWVNTYWPLILPYWFGGGAFNIFLLRQFFRTIPMDLDEAAILDGASRLRIFATIIVPLSRPALMSVLVLSLLHHWNDFLAPVIYLTDSTKWTLAIGISSLSSLESGRDFTHYQMALSTLIVLPVVIVFFLAQRVFIQGIALTGVKG
jgi:ABC-type glycerol-3-phosphate transport system permease component